MVPPSLLPDQHAVLDSESLQQARQDLVSLDLHVAQAGIGRPRARAAIAGAVIDDAGRARGVAQSLREVAPHLDAAQTLVQEYQGCALEPVGLPRHEAAQAQMAVAKVQKFV